MGIAALSQEYASNNAKLVRVLHELNGPVIKIYYVYPSELSQIKRIQFLGKFLQEKLKDYNQ